MARTLAELDAAVAGIEAIIGNTSRTAEEDLAAGRPPELANGDYPIFYRLHQLGAAFNDVVEKLALLMKGGSGSVTPVPTPTPAGTLTSAQLVTMLAALKVYITPNGVGFGIQPDPNSQSAIHVGGPWAAEITGISNTQKSDSQNPNEVHKSSLVISDNDGGMRLRQYSTYKPGGGGEVRNTTNRVQTIFAIDSMGNICVSDSRLPNQQVFYLVKYGNGDVDLCAYHKLAKIRLVESHGAYGAADTVVAP